MASIKTRLALLEQASRATVRRQLTDAERAVRLTHILKNPASSPVYVPLREFLKRPGIIDAQLTSTVRSN